MNPHFFTVPFYFDFIWFRVQGSGFKVQDSRFRAEGAALRYIPHCSITASMPHLAALACAAHYS